ncbi:MAG: Asp23/Gls24 family envelope stress response protein, partial [Candidatus Saccharibacteria bacterium]
ISINKEAVETIAGLATVDCYGLVGMVARNISSGISSILGIESIRKGVEVTETPDGLVVDVFVIVSYGTKISEVAQMIMHKIRYIMEQVTGIKVANVNVNVQGVKIVKE